MLKEGFLFMFVSSFMALFPVANPVGSGFLVNGFLSGLDDRQRKVVIRKIVVNYLLIGLGSLAIGHFVLSLFGLSVPVIELGGGLLICKTALQWLNDSDSSISAAPNKAVDPIAMSKINSQVFYPLTFPISIGPGSVSVIFTLMASASVKGDIVRSALNYALIALVILLMCLILYLFLSQGQRIVSRLGRSGSMIINKMIAFFTFCVGIQIVTEGVAKIFRLNVLQ
ncbi:MarC family protein [Gallalistipes aquisgranensis]|uniref:MarC family protein n=1 Tax=Gallalistipes aquisgranensis TaxID=2779358 RepID=UPI001CF86B55|nr:MarC family protein [Gallalistipes aquisgranensis]MBE5032671.1 MarC family protein [Gallalistipes aquisgranensis]